MTPDLDLDLAALPVRQRRALRLALGGLTLTDALSRSGFRDPLAVVRVLGSPRFAGALQRAAALLPDPVHRRTLLAPLLTRAAAEIAADPRAGGATRLAAAREADALLRGAGSPGAGPLGSSAPGERAPAGGGPPSPTATGAAAGWAALRQQAEARRAAARERLSSGSSAPAAAPAGEAESAGRQAEQAS